MDNTALITSFDKNGVEKFASQLQRLNWRILTSKGTGKYLSSKGINTISVEKYTLQGAACFAKTLQSKLHDGILSDHSSDNELQSLRERGIFPIRIVVCDPYPFEKMKVENNCIDQLMKFVDVGGPALLTAAIRNHTNVFPVIDINDSNLVLDVLNDNLDKQIILRRSLAKKAAFYLEKYYRSISLSFHDSSMNI